MLHMGCLDVGGMYLDIILWMVCMHIVVMYGSKMIACIVIGAVCFVFQGLSLSA